MKKMPLIFILATLLLLIYFTHDYWVQYFSPEFRKQYGDLVEFIANTVGAIAPTITLFAWFLSEKDKETRTDTSALHPDSNHKQGISADIHYEATPIDETIEIDQSQSPYLGLSAFKQKDSDLFFGRQREIKEALAAFNDKTCRWLQIEGNSGAGKSSLVNAGLLPAIQDGKLTRATGYQHWKIIKPIMPGETPLRRLAEALKHSFEDKLAQRSTLELQKELEADERSLAYMLNDLKDDDNTAFVLFVDQFEELFTFAGKQEKLDFDKQLANALQDKDCPLFLISTVRIDFLEGFEQLPKLSELYNQHCKRYLLKTISLEGLQEAIEKPAQMAGLDVSEVTTAILQDAQDEVGALPLVENALQVLWQELYKQREINQSKSNKLSGEFYLQKGGLVGLLEAQADKLLNDIDKKIPKGKHAALELLLELTRINDEGRHTRSNIPIGRACLIAGGKKADKQQGMKIIDYLTGRQAIDEHDKTTGRLRLLTTLGEKEQEQQVSIIHETLIRARGKDKTTGKLVGYWKTLYDYIEKNRDRGFYIDQLARQAETWSICKGLARWRKLASWRDLKNYKALRLEKDCLEAIFKRRSQIKAGVYASLLAIVLGFVGESYWWTAQKGHGFSIDYMIMLQRFRLMEWRVMDEPLPEVVRIPASKKPFQIGEYNEDFIQEKKNTGNAQNAGIPRSEAVEIKQDFYMGKYEVSYEQYDYYVWSQRNSENPPEYPTSPPSETQRWERAVVQVSWIDANRYLQWLSKKYNDKYLFRLPTEVEWEYAARAGKFTVYPWGDTIQKEGQVMANCNGCGSEWDHKFVAPIKSFSPNQFGLYNTAGNVWEWTSSRWSPEFNGSENVETPMGDQSGQRVIRGGSWFLYSDWLRSSARDGFYPDIRYDSVGFRIYRSARTN